MRNDGLTTSERATYQSLRSRGFPHEDAYDAALDGVDVEEVRHSTDFPVVRYLRDNSDVEFEFVALGGMRKAGDPPRYFIADQRYYEGSNKGIHICIHQWTASPVSLLRNLNRVAAFPKPWDKVFVFEARNKGQIAAWLRQYGYNPDYMGQKQPAPHTEERHIVDARERKIALAEQRIAREQERIARIMSLPDEPTTDDPDGALVVWFQHRFNTGSKKYTYAAVKAGDGLWYTTGPASPKGYTWDQLIDWHMHEVNEDSTMWVATEWSPL